MKHQIDFWELLERTQNFVVNNYAAAISDKDKLYQLRPYVEKFIRDGGYFVEGMVRDEVIDKLYQEMAEYSILTPYLGSDDLEEININSWNDIALTYTDGTIMKTKEHFHTPQHAIDIVKRLLQHSGMIIDDANPIAQGHLPHNTRITALKTPIVDHDVGISVSIRLLHPSRIDKTNLISRNTATQEMVEFLEMCIRYGVSIVVAGVTSSGKTTLLNALLGDIPNDKRIFTIETGSRELSLVKQDENGNVINNVVHTLSKPSDNANFEIKQEDLVVASLRFDPDNIIVGEMRDTEAYAAVEASLTGHTVASTVHAGPGGAAHLRIALLCQKKFPIDFNTSLVQAAQAFPIVVYAHKLENNERKIMDISECVITDAGEREYRSLYNYNITKNTLNDFDEYEIEGYFDKPNIMSDSLKRKLIQFGVPQSKLRRFLESKMQEEKVEENKEG